MSLTPDIMHDPGPGAMPTDPSANLNSAPTSTGPRNDFSSDGAVGAGSSAGSSGAGPGTGADGADPWQVAWDPSWNTGDAGSMNAMYSALGENSGKWTKDPNNPTNVYDSVDAQGIGGGGAYNTGTSGENATNLAGLDDSMRKGLGETQAQVDAWNSTMGYHFAEGGSVPDDDQGGGDPQQQAIQQALDTVDGVMAFGYKLHGLGGDDSEDQSGGGQQAANMPTVPASQSSTGQSPAPGPGTLPPTSNPFGQRTQRPLQISANMPTVPASQSNSGMPQSPPGPGTLPPTNNPFGQRTSAPLQMGAIDTDGDDDQEQSS